MQARRWRLPATTPLSDLSSSRPLRPQSRGAGAMPAAGVLAPVMAYAAREVDPVTADPAAAAARPDVRDRVRGVGAPDRV